MVVGRADSARALGVRRSVHAAGNADISPRGTALSPIITQEISLFLFDHYIDFG
jgi:hypothetical protein